MGNVRKSRQRKWTDEEIAYLKEHYPFEPASDISDVLKCSDTTITILAKKLGIKKDKSFKKSNYKFRYVKKYESSKDKSYAAL